MILHSTCIVSDPYYASHFTGKGHPESPERYLKIEEALNDLGLKTLKPRDAAEEDVLLCHTEAYLSAVKEDHRKFAGTEVCGGTLQLSTGDTTICPESLQVALRAVGGILTGVDAVMQNVAQRCFCIVRPPGHHATSSAGMGFCIFNNVAIGVRYAQKTYSIKRVLIVDWDVHHGNGTQEIFYSDPTVFYFSTHELDHYPWTGAKTETGVGEAIGTTLNCPIAPGLQSRKEVISAFNNELIPAMQEFKPELIFISAGFDAHKKDPLGNFNLTDEDYKALTKLVKNIADQHAGGRIVSVLEGGYNLNAIASAAKAHVTAMMN